MRSATATRRWMIGLQHEAFGPLLLSSSFFFLLWLLFPAFLTHPTIFVLWHTPCQSLSHVKFASSRLGLSRHILAMQPLVC